MIVTCSSLPPDRVILPKSEIINADAGYAAVTCTAVTTDDSDDPDISGSSPQAALLSGGNLFMAAVAVATTASLAFSAIFT